jgi:hypothetical protein
MLAIAGKRGLETAFVIAEVSQQAINANLDLEPRIAMTVVNYLQLN